MEKVDFRYHFEGCPKEEADVRIVFIGNSITCHEYCPEIGWFNDWGMAATSKEKDFVHLTLKKFEEKYKKISSFIFSIKKWEDQYNNMEILDQAIELLKEYKPDYIIIRTGDNFGPELRKAGVSLYPTMSHLLKQCKALTDNVYISTLFWRHQMFNDVICQAANEVGAKVFDITWLTEVEDQHYQAIGKFEHVGVSLHPNDEGMQAIADELFKVLEIK